MAGESSRRGLQVVLGIVAAVMVGAGAFTVFFGTGPSVPRQGHVTPDVDSEMRFYAVWYAFAGLVLWRALATIERQGPIVRLVAACFFVAGSARLLSWATLGRPHGTQIALTVAELVIPIVVVLWHRAVERVAPDLPRRQR